MIWCKKNTNIALGNKGTMMGTVLYNYFRYCKFIRWVWKNFFFKKSNTVYCFPGLIFQFLYKEVHIKKQGTIKSKLQKKIAVST